MSSIAKSADYEGLYEVQYPLVLAYCARRVGRQDAVDVAAEVFAVAWRRVHDMPSGERALPWLYGVAYRVVSHHWRASGRQRKLQRRLRVVADHSGEPADSQVVQRHEYGLVLRATARLREKDQELLRLIVWEELSHADVGDVLGIKPAAVRQRFHRAKKALAKEFERLGGIVPPSAVAQEGGEQ